MSTGAEQCCAGQAEVKGTAPCTGLTVHTDGTESKKTASKDSSVGSKMVEAVGFGRAARETDKPKQEGEELQGARADHTGMVR